MTDQRATRSSIEEIGARVLRSRWFFGLGSVAIVGLLALATWPWWFNRFVLTATTRVVEISSSSSALRVHDIGVKLPKSGEIRGFGARADDLPPELAALTTAFVSVRLVISTAILQSISLPSGAELFVRTTSDGGTDIGVLNDGSISLALSGTIERIDEN